MEDHLHVNQKLWDEFAVVHERSRFYGVETFKEGRNTLTHHEFDEVGDVDGKSLVHLMCHIGLDTMSWERLGARAVGVDFSPRSVEVGNSLAKELGLSTRFVESDVYGAPEALDGETYDIVYTSHGVLPWLPDLTKWAQVIAQLLKPGGFFYISELHPFAQVFDDGFDGPVARHPYFFADVELSTGVKYADPKLNASENFQWQHTLSTIINSLVDAGLTIDFVHEFPFALFKHLDDMKQAQDGTWYRPGSNLPFLFSLRAHLPE